MGRAVICFYFMPCFLNAYAYRLLGAWEPWLTMDRTKWDNKIKDNNPAEPQK